MTNSIVITAAEIVTSLGVSRGDTWRNICAGASRIGPLTELEQQPLENRGGGQAPPLPTDYLPDQPREVRYLRWAIDGALRAAGASQKLPYPGDRCGIIMGTTLHGMRAAGRFFRENSYESLRSFLAPPVLEAAAGHLHIEGLALTTCSACSSGLAAIGLGMTLLRSGELDWILCGGYDPISEYAYAGFSSLRLITCGPIRPFAKQREGMKLGEGYAALIIEREDDAKRRGAPVLGKLLGYGESADAHHLTQPHPQGDGAARAMATAIRNGNLQPQDIDILFAHATGTPDNDRGEHGAMRQLFGTRLPALPVSAFKSRLGHTLGGAGAIELILAMTALEQGIIPPIAGVTRETVEYDDLRIEETAVTAPLRVSLNTSIGFGGANASMMMSRADVPTPASPLRDAATATRSALPREVVITGIGVVLPGMVGNDAFAAKLQAISAAEVVATPGVVEDAEIKELVGARRMRRLSAQVKLSIAATVLACCDAKLDPTLHETISVILGSMHGSAGYSGDYYREIVEKGIDAANPMLFAEGVPNSAAAHVSMAMGFKGGCQAILGSRTSGLDALRLATLRIAMGECDRIVVSAGEESAAIVSDVYGRCGLQPASTNPQAIFHCGSGAITLILESRQVAEARGALVRGSIAATASAVGSTTDHRRSIEIGRLMWARLGSPACAFSSAGDASLSRIEHAILQNENATEPHLANLLGEAFSVMPLAAIAAGLLCNVARIPAWAASRATDSASPESFEFGVFCADYTGLLAGARLLRLVR